MRNSAAAAANAKTLNVVPACAPRYCPSLETKFRRFPGRSHHVWLEPEGLASHVLYPNGLSNSLEPEDQLQLLRTVPGARTALHPVWVVPTCWWSSPSSLASPALLHACYMIGAIVDGNWASAGWQVCLCVP